jgi:hypothetical protein
MALSVEEQLVGILRDLRMTAPEVEGGAVVSMDAQIIASSLPSTVEEDRVCAMSAALYGIGTRAAKELQQGEVEQLYIKGEKGYILITHAGQDAVLFVMASAKAKLGVIFFEVRRATEEIARVLAYQRPL